MINQQHLLLPLFTVRQYLFCANSIVCYSFKTHPGKMLCNNKVRLFTSSYQGLPVITHLYVRFIPTVEKHTNLLTSPFQSFPAKGCLLIYKGFHRQSRKYKNQIPTYSTLAIPPTAAS